MTRWIPLPGAFRSATRWRYSSPIPSVLSANCPITWWTRTAREKLSKFKATLEELTYADLIVHVIDASNPEWATQVEVVDELILELGAEKTPRIEAFNKFDIVPMDTVMPKGEHIVRISAKTGEGIEALLAKIRELLDQGKRRAVVHIPYEKGAVVELLHTEASVVSTAYKENCVEIEAVMTPETFGKVKAYVFLTDYTEPDPEDYWNENG